MSANQFATVPARRAGVRPIWRNVPGQALRDRRPGTGARGQARQRHDRWRRTACIVQPEPAVRRRFLRSVSPDVERVGHRLGDGHRGAAHVEHRDGDASRVLVEQAVGVHLDHQGGERSGIEDIAWKVRQTTLRENSIGTAV